MSFAKIGSGAALIVIGVAMLVYAMPIVSNAAASNGPVFTEAAVPKVPSGAMSLVPIEIGALGPLVAGIALVAAGSGERLQGPQTDRERAEAEQKLTKKWRR
jgi:hypothetical protein